MFVRGEATYCFEDLWLGRNSVPGAEVVLLTIVFPYEEEGFAVVAGLAVSFVSDLMASPAEVVGLALSTFVAEGDVLAGEVWEGAGFAGAGAFSAEADLFGVEAGFEAEGEEGAGFEVVLDPESFTGFS